MLYIQDNGGEYVPAPKKLIFSTARKLGGSKLRRGICVTSADLAREAIGNNSPATSMKYSPVFFWTVNIGCWLSRKCFAVR